MKEEMPLFDLHTVGFWALKNATLMAVNMKKGSTSDTMFGDEATSNQEGGPHMNYVGIDYHKKYSHVTAIDGEGRVIRSKRLENNRQSRFRNSSRDLKVQAKRFWKLPGPGE